MRDDAVVLHFVDLVDQDIESRTGFRVTTPVRAIIDVAGTSPDEDQLARAIEDAERNGLLSLRALRSRAEALDPRAALYIERAIASVQRS